MQEKLVQYVIIFHLKFKSYMYEFCLRGMMGRLNFVMLVFFLQKGNSRELTVYTYQYTVFSIM